MKRKNYGTLRHLVYIQQPVDDFTDKGDDEITYDTENQSLAYASIEPLTGRELQFAKQVRADLSHSITLYYRTEYTHRTRLAWNDNGTTRYFQLGPPVDIQNRHKQVTFYAVEIR